MWGDVALHEPTVCLHGGCCTGAGLLVPAEPGHWKSCWKGGQKGRGVQQASCREWLIDGNPPVLRSLWTGCNGNTSLSSMEWIWSNDSLSFPAKKDHQMKVAGDRLQTNKVRYFWSGSIEVLICWSSSLHLGWFVRQLILRQIIVQLLSKLSSRALFIREILLNVGAGLWSLAGTTPQIIFHWAKSMQVFNKVLDGGEKKLNKTKQNLLVATTLGLLPEY